jgi:hypothetical protein
MQPVMPRSSARPALGKRAGVKRLAARQDALDTTKRKAPTTQVPVYEVRLVQAHRPLRLAEDSIVDSHAAARALHALIGLTDREHFACLFVNGQHRVTGAHIVAIGGQHNIASLDVQALFRAAFAACASALVLSHNYPSGIMRSRGIGGRRQRGPLIVKDPGHASPHIRARKRHALGRGGFASKVTAVQEVQTDDPKSM